MIFFCCSRATLSIIGAADQVKVDKLNSCSKFSYWVILQENWDKPAWKFVEKQSGRDTLHMFAGDTYNVTLPNNGLFDQRRYLRSHIAHKTYVSRAFASVAIPERFAGIRKVQVRPSLDLKNSGKWKRSNQKLQGMHPRVASVAGTMLILRQ